MFNIKNCLFISSLFFLIIFTFVTGWRISYNHYAVKQLEKNYKLSQQIIKQRDNVIAITNANISAQAQQANRLQTQLSDINGHYQANLLELQNAKNRLNTSNHINIGLVRAMGATHSSKSTSMPTNASIASEYAHFNESIPASAVAEWTLGLKQDDDNCHEIHNATIKLYDDEMMRINSY